MDGLHFAWEKITFVKAEHPIARAYQEFFGGFALDYSIYPQRLTAESAVCYLLLINDLIRYLYSLLLNNVSDIYCTALFNP
jgi:hypothetical protein